MSEKTIIIDLDGKRTIVLVLVLAIGVFSLYGYITALFAFISPSQGLPLDITGLATFDPGDNPKTSFSRGDTVRIKVTVEKATDYYYYSAYYYYYPAYYYYYDFVGETSYKVIVTVMDSKDRPVFIDSYETTISPGESKEKSFSYVIPTGASTGTYKIRAMAWSDWLPDGSGCRSPFDYCRH